MNVMQIRHKAFTVRGWLLFMSQQRPIEIIFMKKKKKKATHILVSFTDTQPISWSMNSIQFYTAYERIKDKAYRGILAVVKIKTMAQTKLLKLSV